MFVDIIPTVLRANTLMNLWKNVRLPQATTIKVHVLHNVLSGILWATHANRVLHQLHILMSSLKNAVNAIPMKPGTQIPEVATLHKVAEMDFILTPNKTSVLPQVRTLIHFAHLRDLIGMIWLILAMNVQVIRRFMIRSKKFVEFVVIKKHTMSTQNNVLLRLKM